MKINPRSFFEYYIINPLSKELSIGERFVAVALAIILFPATIGILCWNKNKASVLNKHYLEHTSERHAKLNRLSSSIEKIRFEKLRPMPSQVEIPLKNVAEIVNKGFIEKFYSLKVPEKEHVTVPLTNLTTGAIEWKRWVELSKEEKIRVNNTGTHAHNQIDPNESEAKIDGWFFANDQAHYIEGDFREFHGNDHCSRAAIFAGVFAYLYEKYHPDYKVSTQDIALSQIVAAGHDAGRQTEGPDVYDMASAAITKQQLQDLGIQDPLTLHESDAAIEHKDSSPDTRKGLIAKCVQNADCAEFQRLRLTSSKQEQKTFNESRNYLDIFKELEEIAKKNNPENPSDYVLKEDQTFGTFCYELDVLREEMNDFIYQTHLKSFREQAVRSGDYYHTVLNTINSDYFPVLNAVLTKIGIKQDSFPADKIPEPMTNV